MEKWRGLACFVLGIVAHYRCLFPYSSSSTTSYTWFKEKELSLTSILCPVLSMQQCYEDY